MHVSPKSTDGRSPKSISLSDALNFLRDYWFLITVVLSVVGSIFVMVVFHVSPVDKYYEIQSRRDRVKFHNASGKDLLEHGYYSQAKAEFQLALDLEPTDNRAMNGRYLSDLFLQFENTDWDPAIGIVMQDELQHSLLWRGGEFRHIVEKYQGDVAQRTFDTEGAERHYQEALRLNPNYVDALLAYGWFDYFITSNVPAMAEHFHTMADKSPHDYRAFHGLGYARYMQASKAKNPAERERLAREAAEQSQKAYKLGPSQLVVVVDFGEIARPIDPDLAVFFHEYAQQILDDPKMANLPDIAGPLGDKLLASEDSEEVRIENMSQKRAWITYQLALDHLAGCNLGIRERDPIQAKGHQLEHDRLVQKAQQLDLDNKILKIYDDQWKVLQLLAPGPTCKPQEGPKSRPVMP